MRTVREIKALKAARENPLAVWDEVMKKSSARAKARCHKEARERDIRIAATHAAFKII